jgi:lysyl-tRNA synthetase class 2
VTLNDQEKEIFEVMKSHGEMPLSALRAKFDISNKVWDTSIKTLTKNNLLKVSKENELLLVRLV